LTSAPTPPPPISWHETRQRLRRDRERLAASWDAVGERRPALVALHPSYMSVWLHRLAHYLHRRGHRWLARLLWHVELTVLGTDISPAADLGAGLVISHPVGVVLFGKAGRDLTVMAFCGTGALTARDDIGAGPGLPVLGDAVELGPFSGVLGPVRIGDGVRLGPGCIVTVDVPDHAEVVAPVAHVRAVPRA
jgi:serine O-acetyltransferase